MHNVVVYKGEGVSAISFRMTMSSLKETVPANVAVKSISPEEVIEGLWRENALLFVMPGGRDVPYDRALRGKGNHQIKHFVENGGAYLGLCAGAYYGARLVDFWRGRQDAVVEERELQFFPGSAVGPLYDPDAFDYQSASGSFASQVHIKDQNVACFYQGGCYFEADPWPQEVQIISRYLDLENNPVAMLRRKWGQGTVFLSGVHIEYQPRLLKSYDYAAELIESLEKTEAIRKDFFKEVVESLLAKEH